jgi:chromosome segregation ATPase
MASNVDSGFYSRTLLDAPRHYLFFAIFIVGALVILVLHFLSVPQVAVTGFPVALMVSYCAYALWSGRFRYREDRAGDDLYYLGFLFTLVSLGYSLHAFGRLHAIDQIVSNFGIALWTTIVGLAMRVWLYQLRGDPLDEPELESRIDLAESAGRLKAQLASCVEDMHGFRMQLSQSLAEMIADAGTKVAAAIQKGLDEVREKASAVEAAANQAFADMPGHLLTINEAATCLGRELELCWKRIEGIQAPPDLIQRELRPAMELLAMSARRLEEVGRAEQDRAGALTSSLETLATLSDQISGQFQRVGQSAGPLGERIEDTSQQLSALNSNLGAVTQSLNSGLERLAQMVANTAGELETTRNNRRALEEELALIRDQLSPLTRSLNRQARAMEQRAQAEEERTRRLIDEFQLLGGAAEEIRQRIVGGAQSFEQALRLSERLVGVANDLRALGTAITEAGGRVTAGVGELTENLERLAGDTRTNLAAAISNRQALEREVAKSQELVGRVHDALVSMTSLIVERLKNNEH